MKKHLCSLIILVCLVSALEALLTQGLNFANPYGKVPAAWWDRAQWSTLVAWISAGLGLILILSKKWHSTHT